MEINSNLSFQARVPVGLRNVLKNETLEKSSNILQHLDQKIKCVEKWGDENSAIYVSINSSGNGFGLSLDNSKISRLYGAVLPESKKGLLSSFMRLTKKDILKAENDIRKKIEKNKVDLICKAISNKKLMKKITGKNKASYEELDAAINKLSEQEICNLRFDLDKYNLKNGSVLNLNI